MSGKKSYGNRLVGRSKIAIRKTLIAFLMVTIASTGWTGTATSSKAERVEEQLTLINELRAIIDRSQFDLQALGDRLDWDPESIMRFVREEIEFEQYPGLLRGAQGTLMSRAGNSLDQAVLLAKLLKDAGLEARIARGNLNPEQIRTLLEQMLAKRAQPPAPADIERWSDLSARTKDERLIEAIDTPRPTDDEIDLAVETAGLLEKALAENGSHAPDNSQKLSSEAADYYWVEYRDSAGSSWQGIHPVFGAAQAQAPTLVASEYFAREIPQELQHQFRLAVFIERAELDQLKVHQVVPDWQRPAANMLGRSFSIFNYPDGFKGDLFEIDIEKAIAESELFTPVFDGEILPGTMGFDLDGVPYDLTATGPGSFGASPLFRTVGDKMDRAIASLQGLGSSEPANERTRYLTAQWIEYTLIAPGGEEKTFRRYVFDRIGPAVRASGTVSEITLQRARAWQLLSADEFLVAAGRYPDAFVLDELTVVKKAGHLLRRELYETGDFSMRSVERVSQDMRGPSAFALLALLRSFDTSLRNRLGTATYRPEPNLLALHVSFSDRKGQELSTDIISSQRRSRLSGVPESARSDVLFQGVWETVAERRAFDILGIAGDTVRSPFTLTVDVRNSGAELQLIHSGEVARLGKMDIPEDQRVLIADELERGSAVLLLPGQSLDRLAWWRIDPITGSTVGILPDGRGSVSVEYKLLLAGVVVLLAAGPIFVFGRTIECKYQVSERAIPDPDQRSTLADRGRQTYKECLTDGFGGTAGRDNTEGE